MTRAQHLVAAALLAHAASTPASVLIPQVALPGKAIPKFVDPVPEFGPPRPGGGPTLPRVPAACTAPGAPGCAAVTTLDGAAAAARVVRMQEFQQQVLPASVYPAGFANGTWVWGYKIGDAPPLYPAVTLEATKGRPAFLEFLNEIPAGSTVQQYLSVDQTVHWADPLQLGCMAYMNFLTPAGTPAYPAACFSPFGGPVPTVVHLHGAETPGEFDGGPDQWWTADAAHRGALFRSYAQGPANAATYWYANQQQATTLWFHDHALGSTRINVFAGLAGFYLLRDDPADPNAVDTGAARPGGLPAGPYERELLIQDRQFDTNGQFLFPDGNPSGLNGPPTNPLIHPFWSPEFLGDAIVVNGKTWPYMNVEPRRYRLRLVNGSNARMFQLALADAGTGRFGPAFWQIGTDGGLLAAPVKLNDPALLATGAVKPQLLLAPGERADLVVDFSGVRPGTVFTLRNSARAPFPKGPPPDPQTTGQLMQFRVVLPLAPGGDASCAPPACALRPASPIQRLVNADGTVPANVKIDVRRQLVLREIEGAGGPVEVLLNNSKWMGVKESTIQLVASGGGAVATGQPVDGSTAMLGDNYVTEAPRVSATEEWEIINTTADAHPIHVHLVQFQLLNRQPYQASAYDRDWSSLLFAHGKGPGDGPPSTYGVTTDAQGQPVTAAPGQPPIVGGNVDVTAYLQAAASGPLPTEYGWKDTVVMYPGEVTRILVRYTPQAVPIGASSAGTPWTAYGSSWSPEKPFGAFAQANLPSPGYVWHCHILDHEDNEMMRPYAVVP